MLKNLEDGGVREDINPSGLSSDEQRVPHLDPSSEASCLLLFT